MTGELQRALVRYQDGADQRWLAFERPCAQIRADRIEDVVGALDRAERFALAGRWVVGMVAYDAAPAFDAALVSHRDPTVPLVAFGVFEDARPSAGPAAGLYAVGAWTANRRQADYQSDVVQVREYIAAGDVYQVNYTMQLSATFAGSTEAFFAGLSRAQRGDHLAWIEFEWAAVCSASPELFLRRRGEDVETRPMKGTRPRGSDAEADRRYAADLVASEKDRAENTMIVDMARNDLGRVARVGSVTTSALHTVESYPTVHQLTSTVRARTAATFADLMVATFPAASITGAPKVAASRIIAELEGAPRGVYTGAVGVLAPGGDFDFNVAIRTAWVDKRAGRVTYGVGGGIVWDSDPVAEWHEAHDKARILRRAAPPFRLLETMAWSPAGGVFLLDRHLARLAEGARHFGFDVDLDEVRQRLAKVEASEGRRLRLLVEPDGALELQVLELMPWFDPSAAPADIPLDLQPVDSSDEFLRYKTTRRERYEQARSRFVEADDVVLWNERGELTESTIGNLVVERAGERLTPSAESGLLPGTLRADLLARGEVREARLLVAQIGTFDRAWVVNSVRGWRSVTLRG